MLFFFFSIIHELFVSLQIEFIVIITMKKYIVWTALMFIMTASAWAQATQPCVVLQYNQKQPKTPLGGVEVMVKGANSTVSPDDGKITLLFHTLKPGDRIEKVITMKSGYEIFNTDVVNNWIISRNNSPFELIMVRSDYLAQHKANLTQVSQDSYKKKLEQKEKELRELKEEGKLKEEEFQKKYNELYDNYIEQLKNLNNYIDQFARIDLSEVSAVEQRIVEMVENGKIEEAIQVFDSLDLTKKISNEAEDILELTKGIKSAEELRSQKKESIDSLYRIVKRKVSLELMANKFSEAKDDLLEVLEVFNKLFYVDPDTYRPQVADLQLELSELLNNLDALPYADSALSNLLILYKTEPERYTPSVARAKVRLAKCKKYFLDYVNAEVLLLEALSYYEQQAAQDSLQYHPKIASTHCLLGQLYSEWQAKKDRAEKHFLSALEIYIPLTQQDTSEYLPSLASLKAEIGSYYCTNQKREKIFEAERYLSDAIMDYQILSKTKPEYLPDLEKQQAELGALYYVFWLKFNTEEYYSKAEACYKAAYQTATAETISLENAHSKSTALKRLVELYIQHQEFQKADEIISDFSNDASFLSDIGYIYLKNGQPQRALPYLDKAVVLSNQTSNLYDNNTEAPFLSFYRNLDLSWLFMDLALCHFLLGDTAKMDETLKKGFELLDSVFSKIHNTSDTVDYRKLTFSLVNIKKATQELKTEQLMTPRPNKKQDYDLSTYDIKVQEYYYQFVMRNYPDEYEDLAYEQRRLGYAYMENEKYNNAVHCYQNALATYELLKTEQPEKFDLYDEVAECLKYLGKIYNYYIKDKTKAENYFLQALQQYALAEKHDAKNDLFNQDAFFKYRFKISISYVQLWLSDLYYQQDEYRKADTQLVRAYNNFTLYFKKRPDIEYTLEDKDVIAEILYRRTYFLLELSELEEYDIVLPKAIEIYDELHAAKPEEKIFKKRLSDLLYLQARRNAQLGNVDESIILLARCQDVGEISNQRLANGYNSAAYAYASDKKYKDALKAIDQAISLCPKEANYYDSKGEILLMKGDKKGALKMWQKVLELEPDFVNNHDGGSELYKQLKEKGLIQ